ncbi:MAG: MBOAT family protein [Bacteroidales bacterium]|nr:MBOAT family protein [Bacteroidales bacterium]
MQFDSIIFLFFATLFFCIWRFAKSNISFKLIFLTVASFLFYGWWDWRFIFLILFSGFIDYFAAIGIISYPKSKKLLLIFSLLANIGTLSIFKYSGFISENIDLLLGTSLNSQINNFLLITPIGISFYTFQSMSYTIDVYKGKFKPTKNVFQFFAYLSMFPQLVAGPIVRAKDMLPQLIGQRQPLKEDRWEGFRLIVKGCFKKMVIADNLAPIVATAFNSSIASENSFFWWGAVIAFAFQIYCDFSGYSDIACGLARWMGYSFPDNFNHPYTSTSLKDFWGRWHISLSTWFRDYVYIPLGGNKKSNYQSHINMWITMLISGLWHGAAWTYIIWGGVHALFLSIERIVGWPAQKQTNQFIRFTAWVFVILEILVAWVFFRASSVQQAFDILKTMFSFKGNMTLGWGLNGSVFLLIIIIREIMVYIGIDKKFKFRHSIGFFAEMLFYAVLITLIIFFRGSGSEFIYFQF